jgi:SPX domain protein involved in polyphosphate accumulation
VKPKLFPELEYLQTDWRFEYKYRLSFQQYLQIRSSIRPAMRMDTYSLAAPQQRYLVRSLYFDTDTFTNYVEKVHGDSDRVKLRIRSYSAEPSLNMPLRAEFKARRGITVEKHSTWIDLDDYQSFSHNRHWLQHEDPVLIEFERYVHLKSLRPKIIVEYLREGYRARSGDNVRITFDHQVRSAHAAVLFPQYPFFGYHHPTQVVLEIKCDAFQPSWLQQMVITHGLRPCTNSKYIQGINACRLDVATPSWSY